MPCDPTSLAALSKCFCGLPKKQLKQVAAYLTCAWANKAKTSYIYSAVAFHENDGILRVFGSNDAITFTEVSESYIDSAPLRDPTIIYYYGKYWCAYTLNGGYQSVGSPAFGLASSLDGITWTKVTNIPYSSALNYQIYAPSWFISPIDGSLHIVLSSSVVGDNNQFYIYETHPLDSTLLTWSALSIIDGAGFRPSYSMIDPFIEFVSGTYYLWYKNDTNKWIEVASSASPFSNYTIIHSGDWAGWGHGNITGSNNGYEAPCVVTLQSGVHRVFIDNSVSHGILYSDSADYSNWSALQPCTWNNPSGFTMSQPDVRLLTPPV